MCFYAIKWLPHFLAQVVELVDTPGLGSGAARYVGSSPILGISLGGQCQKTISCSFITQEEIMR